MLMKLAPASVATALASKVLPVPGGPNNKTPLQGCSTCHQLSENIRKDVHINNHIERTFSPCSNISINILYVFLNSRKSRECWIDELDGYPSQIAFRKKFWTL